MPSRPDERRSAARPALAGAPISMSPALELMRALLHVSHGIERMSKKMEASIGVTAQQRLVVRIVGRHPGVTPGRLAEHLHVDPGTVSAILRRLEGKGLVRRTPDPRDGRRATLGLTDRGRALDRPETGTVEAVVDAVLRTEDPAATQQALALLARLAARLEAEAGQGPRGTP